MCERTLAEAHAHGTLNRLTAFISHRSTLLRSAEGDDRPRAKTGRGRKAGGGFCARHLHQRSAIRSAQRENSADHALLVSSRAESQTPAQGRF